MVKAEISEIKKLFTINNCSISRICGCYVDGEKNIKSKWVKPFLSMDEEDLLKYLEIFKKCLSGGLEKNLINVELKNVDKRTDFQLLRNSKLKKDAVLENYWQRIIDTYEYVGNYLILTIHDVYDIPGKTSDNVEMEDASDEVYEYILTCICPVNLSKPGLSYNMAENVFQNRIQDWIVATPEVAILYPAFNDRSEDLNAALYYAKNLQEPDKEFAFRLLGAEINLSHNEEKDTFKAILEETLGRATLNEVRSVQEKMIEMVEEHRYDPEPMKLNKNELEKLFSAANLDNAKMERFGYAYRGNAEEDTEFTLNNITNMAHFYIDTDAYNIRIKPDYADEVSIREIDGHPCLVLNILGEVKANGITIHTED